MVSRYYCVLRVLRTVKYTLCSKCTSTDKATCLLNLVYRTFFFILFPFSV